MIHRLEKYLNAGYSATSAQRELSRVYHAAANGQEAGKVVKVTRVGAIQEVRVGQIPRSKYALR